MVKNNKSFLASLFLLWPCHRMPERSVRIGHGQMPICSRCFGIILGLPVGLTVGYQHLLSSRWFGLIFLIPMILDLGTQETGLRKSSNDLRLITGFLGGIGMGVFVVLWILNDLTIK